MTLTQCKSHNTENVSCIDHACFQTELNGDIKSRDIEVFTVKSVTVLKTSEVPDDYLVARLATFSPRRSQSLEVVQSGFQLFLSFSKFSSLLCKSLVLGFQISDAFFRPL